MKISIAVYSRSSPGPRRQKWLNVSKEKALKFFRVATQCKSKKHLVIWPVNGRRRATIIDIDGYNCIA